MYHFLSGYTAQGGRHREGRDRAEGDVQHLLRRAVPAAAIRTSTRRCSARRSRRHNARVWLVNTGWTGGPYGVGSRMKIAHTRAMITRGADRAARRRRRTRRDPIFNLDVPTTCPACRTSVLDPRSTWPDAAQYDEQATKLARMFVDNFKTFESGRRRRRSRRPDRAPEASTIVNRRSSPSSASRFTRSC